MQLQEVANITGGRLKGDPTFHVDRLNVPDRAKANDLVFAFSDRSVADVSQSGSMAIVTVEDRRFDGKNQVFVDNPRRAYVRLASYFSKTSLPSPGIDPRAFIHSTARIEPGVHIGAFVYVGANAFIGRDTCLYPQSYVGEHTHIGCGCVLYPQVVVREGCCLGDRVILHSGVIIGGDGFGYEAEASGLIKLPHLGSVEIRDDVEIGANSTVDRGTIGPTRIGKGTKIDNLVMVAHNVQVGESVIIAAQSGIAGSSRVGDRTMMGGQSGVVDHCSIGQSVKIAARSAVISDIPDRSFVSGFPAQDHRLELREKAQVRRLSKIWDRIKQLEKAVFKK